MGYAEGVLAVGPSCVCDKVVRDQTSTKQDHIKETLLIRASFRTKRLKKKIELLFSKNLCYVFKHISRMTETDKPWGHHTIAQT